MLRVHVSIAFLTIAAGLLACDERELLFPPPSEPDSTEEPDDPVMEDPAMPGPKIDDPVLAAMETRTTIPVIILGAEQFLEPPDGYANFIAAEAETPRSDLRIRVVYALKNIAERVQPSILATLDSPEDARSLWIVNAVIAVLTPPEIERVADLASVRFIYLAQAPPPAVGPAGTVFTVLNPGARPAFTSVGKTVSWNVEMVGAKRVWDELGVTGEGSIVAVLDNGVRYVHDDLRDAVWVNPGEVANNAVDDDGNGYVDDYYGFDFGAMSARVFGGSAHGTWVTGIAVGDGSGGTVTGIAPGARFMALRGGSSTYPKALAYQYAIEHGADVLNMSFSIPNLGNVRGFWRLMADHATVAGLVSTSGAGNFRQTATVPVQLRIPEGIPSVIAVGGVDRNLRVTFFSSTGPVEWASVRFYGDLPNLNKPDVVAFPGPGYALLDPMGGYFDPNTSVRGNSFSGPHLAGVAALMFEANPELPAWRVKEIVEASAQDLGDPGKDNESGSGLADAFDAVEAAMSAQSAARAAK